MEQDALEVLYPNTVVVDIGGVGIEIGPMKFTQNRKLLALFSRTIQRLRKGNKNIEVSLNVDKMISLLPTLLGEDLLEAYAIVTGKENAWLEDNLDLNSEANLLKAFFEVNDIPFLLKTWKEVAEKIKAIQTETQSEMPLPSSEHTSG